MLRERRKHQRRSFLIVLALLFLPFGCATRHARLDERYASRPHLYPATRYAANGKVVDDTMDAVGFKYASGWLLPGNLMEGLALEVVFSLYSLVVEIPASVITDTALLPYDICKRREFKEGDAAFQNALLGDAWPVSSHSLREWHVPISSDRIIRMFVEQTDTPEAKAKTRALIDAGLCLELVAKSPLLDAELVGKLLEKADGLGTDLPEKTVDPDLSRVLAYRAGQAAGRSYGSVPDYGTLAFSGFLRQQLVRNAALPPDALISVVMSSDGSENPSALALLSETAFPPGTFEALIRDGDGEIRKAVAANPHAPPNLLASLGDLASQNAALAVVVAGNPKTAVLALEKLSRSDDPVILRALARNPELSTALLGCLASRASDDIPLAVLIAKHPNTDLETLATLVGLENAEVGEVVVGRYDTPPAFLDTLSRIADTNSAAGVRMGREIARHPDANAETLNRLASIDDFAIRSHVAGHRNARADTLDSLAEFAKEEWLYGATIARNPNTAAQTLRRLGELEIIEINEQLTYNVLTPPETLGRLARQALAILSQPVSSESYQSMMIVERTTRHPQVLAEALDDIAEAACRLDNPVDTLKLFEAILDNPKTTPGVVDIILKQIAKFEKDRSIEKKMRQRIVLIKGKAEEGLK